MSWHLVERSDGAKLLETYETREEAEQHRARLIAEDPAYEDVLSILSDEGGDEPRPGQTERQRNPKR